MSYLIHYGTKGMKWGIRKYQNSNGSWTKEGLARRKEYRQFNEMVEFVNKKASNSYSPIKMNTVDRDEVKRRSSITNDKEIDNLLEEAIFAYDKVKSIEPKITNDVVSAVVSVSGKMYGLENRLKQPTSLAGKMGADGETNPNKINDKIRYTCLLDNDDYTNKYYSIKNILQKNNYKEVKCKNNFVAYREGKVSHKSVQCVYADKNGNTFEIQFQTPQSQAAKELKLPLYEEVRRSGITKERKNYIEKKMRELADYVPDPPNVYTIGHSEIKHSGYVIHWR